MIRATDLSNVLGAESLLLTLITFAYGLVYPELAGAAALALKGRQLDDVKPDRTRVRAARWRARAIAAVAVIVGGVFAPPSVEASWNFLQRLPRGLHAFDEYNTVATTIVLVTIGCFLIAGHALFMAKRLTRTLRRLSP